MIVGKVSDFIGRRKVFLTGLRYVIISNKKRNRFGIIGVSWSSIYNKHFKITTN